MNICCTPFHNTLLPLILICLLVPAGCSLIRSPLNQAREYSKNEQYDAAVEKLTGIIDSDASEQEKAQAFMFRGYAYSNLKEYRYAYRDYQVAWKLSCHIYQNLNETTENNETEFVPAQACIEEIPPLIDELKPFTSDFGAIMATQEASAIVKKMFPDIPR